MKKTILFAFLFIQSLIFAQNDYFEHTVSKGETLYQLSRKYNVKIAQIYGLNSSIEGDLIRENEVLRIPRSGASVVSASQQEDEDFIYHVVESGETKFGLQRRYGMQISQIESDNPHIVSMLQAGHRVRIRKSLAKNTVNKASVASSSGNNIHTVVKGETLTAISRQHGVSLSELVAVNRDNLGEFLQIGQRLVIPRDQKPTEYTVTNNPVHIVQPGETKFGLSRKYKTSIETLERLNPQILTMLKAGHTLILPVGSESESTIVQQKVDTVVENPVQNQVIDINPVDDVIEDNVEEQVEEDIVEEHIVQEDSVIEDVVSEDVVEEKPKDVVVTNENDSNHQYVDYEVQPKETLFGLSKKANLTQDKLLELNPSLKDGVRIGMIIKMPAHLEQTEVASTIVLDASLTDLTKKIVSESQKLLLVLPIEESDYEKFRATKQFGANREEVEFYSGALIAVDSIKKLGVDIDLNLINTKTTELTTDYISSVAPNVIIGISSQSGSFSTDVPFIYPFTANFDIDANLFKAIPSKNQRVNMMIDYLKTKKGNVIVIGDSEKTVNRDIVAQNLPNAKFLSINDRVNPDVEGFKNALDSKNKNYVILDTERTPLFLNATNMLLNQMADYDIQLVIIEETSVIKEQQVSLMRLRILKALYTSLYREQENNNSLFYKEYFNRNKVLPTENAVRGFDVTFDVLLRVSQDISFEESAKNQISKQNRQKFEYQKIEDKKIEDKKYQNKAAYILFYDSDSDAKIAN